MRPDREMACHQPDDAPRRSAFAREFFAFGGLMAFLILLYGIFA